MIQVNRPMTLGALVVGALALGAASASAQDQLGDMTKDPNQWVMAGRTYDLQRYSPLTQITAANVKGLHAAWSFSTGTLRGHEGAPLVIGSVMYVHTSDRKSVV